MELILIQQTKDDSDFEDWILFIRKEEQKRIDSLMIMINKSLMEAAENRGTYQELKYVKYIS